MKRASVILAGLVLLSLLSGCYAIDDSGVPAPVTAPSDSGFSVTYPNLDMPPPPSSHSSSAVQSSLSAALPASSSQSNANDQKRRDLEAKYGVKIYYGDEFVFNIPPFTAVRVRDEAYIRNSLNLLDTELGRYPSGFFAELSRELRIYLLASFSNEYAGMAAYQDPAYFELYLTINPDSMSILHHEMMHMIDFTMQEKPGYSGFSAWNGYNPPGFKYTGKDYNQSPYIYKDGGNWANTYFATDYSLKEDVEDRAEIFRILMTDDNAAACFSSLSPLKNKLLYMTSEIRRVFKSVQNTPKAPWERFN